MEIKYAIVSSDENPLYYDFWPIVRDLWSNHIGIKPVFLFITNKDEVIDHGEYIVHKVKSIEGVDTGLQSQIIRMYATKFYPNDVCITSDIDMLPLGKSYFKSICGDYNDDDMVILSSDAYPNKVRYPICYNVGKGSTFNEILDLNCSFEEYVKRLSSYNWGWDTDELYFGMKVNEFKYQNRIKKLNRGWYIGIANNRIDRVRWAYDKNKLQKGEYIDSHSLRPYSECKNHIDKLVQDLNE
jgi:hypothetical protein